MMKIHKRVLVVTPALCLIIGLLLWIDAVSTRSRNEADKQRLAKVRLGMDEDTVAALMGRKPIKMPGDSYRSYLFVGERESVFQAIVSPNKPTISKTIIFGNGRVNIMHDTLITR